MDCLCHYCPVHSEAERPRPTTPSAVARQLRKRWRNAVIKRLYGKGLSMKEVGKRMGVSRWAVSRALQGAKRRVVPEETTRRRRVAPEETTRRRMATTGNEAVVYRAVVDGRLQIDGAGRVWRGAKRAEHQKNGYWRLTLRINSKLTNTGAHRLVWHHFFGPIPQGLEVNHRNGDGFDNRPANLELLTPRENSLHAYHILGRTGLTPEARSRGIQTSRNRREEIPF